MVHLAPRFHVVIQLHHARFLGGKSRTQLLKRPGKIVAVVIERIIGVLAGVEAALRLVGEDLVHPADDSFGDFAEERITGHLPGVEIVPKKLGIVVTHFFEVRNQPALVHRIAVETAGELVIDAAAAHSFECAFHNSKQVLLLGLLVALEQKVERRGMREFGGAAETAVPEIEHLHHGANLLVDNAGIKCAAGAGECLRLGDSLDEGFGSFEDFAAAILIGVGDGHEDALEARAAQGVFGRKIRAAEERFAVRGEKTGEGPAALARDGADGSLIARIHIGALVAVHFDGDIEAINEFCDFGILVTFAVNDVTPVAPHRADVEKDGFILGAGAGEGFFPPFKPADGLMRGGAQIRAGRIFQTVIGRRSCGDGCARRPRQPGHRAIGSDSPGRCRAGRGACARQNLRAGHDKSGCGLRRGASRDTPLCCQ